MGFLTSGLRSCSLLGQAWETVRVPFSVIRCVKVLLDHPPPVTVTGSQRGNWSSPDGPMNPGVGQLCLVSIPSSGKAEAALTLSLPTGGSRGLVHGRLWRKDGVLAVTCAQEGVIRLKPRVSASKL